MTYRLFLDDERFPPEDDGDWTIARNFDEAVAIVVNHGLPSYMSLDHDLGEDLTGYDFALWIVGHALDNKLVWTTGWFVHSMNPVGAANIRALLDRFEQFCREEA